jgi:hypothetical protein
MLTEEECRILTEKFWKNMDEVVEVVRKRELVIDRTLPEYSVLGSKLPYRKRKWKV